jgi:hypothetical protein
LHTSILHTSILHTSILHTSDKKKLGAGC